MLEINSAEFAKSTLRLNYTLANSGASPQLSFALIYNPGGYVGREVETKPFHSQMDSESCLTIEVAVPGLPSDWDPAHPLNCLGFVLEPGQSYAGSISSPVPVPQIVPYHRTLQSGSTGFAHSILLRIGSIPLGQHLVPRKFLNRGETFYEVSQATAHAIQVVEEATLTGVSFPVFLGD